MTGLEFIVKEFKEAYGIKEWTDKEVVELLKFVLDMGYLQSTDKLDGIENTLIEIEEMDRDI